MEEALAESYEQRLSGLGDATTRAHMIIGAGAPQRMAQGDTFADRVIAGIGKDLEARVSMLEGRAASARTAVEARMGAYIEMYAGGDDTIAASVDDYRYYQDELESLSKLATVEATAVEYHNCLDKLLMSFLTIKRAIDTDAGDIHDQLERINAMLDGQQFGPRHGSLSLHADVRRPERAFWSALTRVIGTLNDRKAAQTDDDLDGARCAFASCAAMIDMLRREIGQIRDVNGVKRYGARNLAVPILVLRARAPLGRAGRTHHLDRRTVRRRPAGADLVRVRRGADLPARRRNGQQAQAFLHDALP